MSINNLSDKIVHTLELLHKGDHASAKKTLPGKHAIIILKGIKLSYYLNKHYL